MRRPLRATIIPSLVWAIVFVVGASVKAADEGSNRPPNIVVIVADDLGWADLGCYGADLHETPCLDRLAARGIRFTQAYAAAPVCTPTRAALLTGYWPARLKMTTWYESAVSPPNDRPLVPPVVERDLPHTRRTLATALSKAGYATAHVGKWHLGGERFFPETHGYDIHIAGNSWGAPRTHFFPYHGNMDSDGERRYVPGLGLGKPEEYLADRLTSEAEAIIEHWAGGDRPFFLTLWHYAVHAPIEAPAARVQHFETRRREEYHHQNATYAAMVENLDTNVGRIVDTLERLKLLERTVIVFTSDNGGYLNNQQGQVTSNAPLRSGKGSLYEGGLRVPLLVAWPGAITNARTCDVPVTSIDLYSTLLDAAGRPADDPAQKGRDGTSLLPLCHDAAASLGERPLFFHYPHYYPTTEPAGAMRHGSWKLIEYFGTGGKETHRHELYDLDADPYETHDLAQAEPERASSMADELAAWRDSVDAPMPKPNPKFAVNR